MNFRILFKNITLYNNRDETCVQYCIYCKYCHFYLYPESSLKLRQSYGYILSSHDKHQIFDNNCTCCSLHVNKYWNKYSNACTFGFVYKNKHKFNKSPKMCPICIFINKIRLLLRAKMQEDDAVTCLFPIELVEFRV